MASDKAAAAVIGGVAILGGIGYYLYTSSKSSAASSQISGIELTASLMDLEVGQSDTLTAIATDSAGNPVAGATIKFYGDGQYLGMSTTNSTGTATFTTEFYSAGTYQVYAES